MKIKCDCVPADSVELKKNFGGSWGILIIRYRQWKSDHSAALRPAKLRKLAAEATRIADGIEAKPRKRRHK